MRLMNMSGEGSPWNESDGNDFLKPKEINLLDNVSFMTTISPMPSQNNTLQQNNSSNPRTQDLLDDIFRTNPSPATVAGVDPNNVSTFTDIQVKLRAQLESTGTTMSSTATPPTTHQVKHQGTGEERVMHGFDLSPIHSIDKGTAPTNTATTQDEAPSIEALNTRNRGEFSMAPNFMQAKGTFRVAKSEKAGTNEDTETMMSQVFSSQDVASLANDPRTVPRDEAAVEERVGRKKRTDVNVKTARSEKQDFENLPAKKQTVKTRGSSAAKFSKSREALTSSKGKRTVLKSPSVKKISSNPSSEIVPPKSPKTRQTAVRVTPRMKTSPKRSFTKSGSHRKKLSPPLIRKNPYQRSDEDLNVDSPGTNKIYKGTTHISPVTTASVPRVRAGVNDHEESVSLIHILDDLNEMRSQVADVQEQLVVVSKERDGLRQENEILKEENVQLKKDNFVIKSRLDKIVSNSDRNKDSIEGGNETTDGLANKLKQDMAEQERLIVGYQKENERVYEELKREKQDSKDMEQAMYEENLKLKSQMAKLKEDLDLQTAIVRGQSSDLDRMQIQDQNDLKDLGSDVSQLNKRVKLLENQIRAEEGLRLKAEMLVRKVTEERDEAEKRLTVNACKAEESRNKLVVQHKTEVDALKSELVDARRTLGSREDAALTIRDILTSPPSKSMMSHLRKRVHKLESDLENRDTQANRAVTSLQEQYSHIKGKYEERINDLERQIKAFRENMKENQTLSVENGHEKETLKKKLAEALARLQEESDHRRTERDALFDQINTLRHNQKATQEEKPAGTEASTNDFNLRKECELKDREISRLIALVERLSERTQLKDEKKIGKKAAGKRSEQSYNPSSFEGEGYAGLLERNSKLEQELENREIELKHANVTKDARIVTLEQEVQTQKSRLEKELFEAREQSCSKQSSPEINNVLAEKVAGLEQKLLAKCRELSEVKSDLKHAAVFKVREQALQLQIQKLVSQVHEAKLGSSSSSTRDVVVLEDKVRVLEEKLRIKESELRNSVISSSDSVLQSEMRNMQVQIERKNRELTKFRLELDSILLVLKELHSQGVKIPLPKYLQSLF